jgi:pantetheine-phosphate adenylyltransferase
VTLAKEYRVLAIYAGRFDPATNGHLDIAIRASKLFSELLIAVYQLPPERSLFSTEERVKMMRDSVAGHDNVRVVPFSGLLTTFARDQGAQVLVRGIRAVTDFYAEFDQALMYKRMQPEIEQVYLISDLQHLFISASRIKEVYQLGYDVLELVPPPVLTSLQRKFPDALDGAAAPSVVEQTAVRD